MPLSSAFIFQVTFIEFNPFRSLLLRQQRFVNRLRQNASLSDHDTGEHLGELLVATNRQLQKSGSDAELLVSHRRDIGQIDELGAHVFHDGREKDGGAGSDALVHNGLAELPLDSADGEVETGSFGTRLLLDLRIQKMKIQKSELSPDSWRCSSSSSPSEHP